MKDIYIQVKIMLMTKEGKLIICRERQNINNFYKNNNKNKMFKKRNNIKY